MLTTTSFVVGWLLKNHSSLKNKMCRKKEETLFSLWKKRGSLKAGDDDKLRCTDTQTQISITVLGTLGIV
jgi:hypothetical protein